MSNTSFSVKMRSILTLLFLFIFSSSSFAQIATNRLDSLFNILEAEQLAKGEITITQNGKVLYRKSFDTDDVNKTKYRIGSITKVFTAALTFQLIDAQKLALTDRLAKFFPNLPNADKITIEQLLGHRSGLANYTDNTDFDNWKLKPKSQEELLALIKGQKPDFEPNSRASYCNTNYLLLSFILEQVYKKSYSTILSEKIIKPVGLKNTYYGSYAGYGETEAISYKYLNNQWNAEPAVNLNNFSGAGAIISTTDDLCQFISVLFQGKIVSKKSLETMKRLQDRYGKGLFPYGNESHPGFGHNGKTEGFASSLQYYPEKKLAIAYCTNGEVYTKTKILDHVFKACFGLPDTLPTFCPIQLSDQQLNNFIGTYRSNNGMGITSHIQNGQLLLSLKGQDFELLPIGPSEFRNKPFGCFFDFAKEGKQLLIHDVESTYELEKR